MPFTDGSPCPPITAPLPAFGDGRRRWLAARWGDHVRGLSYGYGKILIDRAVPVEADLAGDAVLHPFNQFVPADRLHVLVRDGHRITGILPTFVSRCRDPMYNDGRIHGGRCTISRDWCCRKIRVQPGIEVHCRHNYKVPDARYISDISVRYCKVVLIFKEVRSRSANERAPAGWQVRICTI